MPDRTPEKCKGRLCTAPPLPPAPQIMALAKGNKRFAAIDRAIAKDGLKFVTLLRLSPLLPLALSNYMYGGWSGQVGCLAFTHCGCKCVCVSGRGGGAVRGGGSGWGRAQICWRRWRPDAGTTTCPGAVAPQERAAATRPITPNKHPSTSHRVIPSETSPPSLPSRPQDLPRWTSAGAWPAGGEAAC